MAQTITVLELPPRAFASNLVSALSLYGTFFPILPDYTSASVEITKPKVLRDLFIFAASFKRSPVAPVFPTFSEPAKSTKFITDSFWIFLLASSVTYLNSIIIIVWALDDVAFLSIKNK